MTKKVLTLTLLVGIVLAILAGRGVFEKEKEAVLGAEAHPIKIGAILSLSGPAVNDGEVVRDGIELAIADLRDQGQDVEIVYFDDKTDPKQTVSSVQLARAQGVDAVIGFTWDFLFNSAAPVLESEGIVGVAPTNTSEYTTSSTHGFYGAPKTSDSRDVLAGFLRENNIQTVAFVAGQFAWSEAHLANLHNAVGDVGGEVVAEHWMQFGVEKDAVRTIMAEIAQQEPDAIFIIPAGDQTLFAITQAIQTHQIQSMLIVGSTTVGRFLEQNPGALSDEYPIYSLVPTGSAVFAEYFEQNTDRLPGEYTEYAYDATRILVEALRGKHSEESLEGYLQNNTFTGFAREYSFDENHDIINGLWQIRKDN